MHDGTGDGAGLLRRAERHLDRAREAGGDADLALSAAWLASRYALLAVLRVEGIELEDTAPAIVTACAGDVLPPAAAAAAAALEDAAARDDPGADPSAHAAHAGRVVAAAGRHLGRVPHRARAPRRRPD